MKSLSLLFAAAAACLLLQPAAAPAEEAPPDLVRSFVLVPQPGAGEALHQALKAHGEWRLENGETWDWYIYTRVAGEGSFDIFVIRSGGQRWADFNAYSEFGEKALPHFNETVAPHLAHIEGHIHRWALEISHWPDDAGPYSMFWVYDYQLRPGGSGAAMAALKEITGRLREAGWQRVYAWEVNLTGTPSLTLVVPAADWSGFEDPARTATEVLADALGEEAARLLWASFTDQVTSIDSSIWVEVPELRVTVQRSPAQ
jgi:hypothetical protein